MKYISRIKLDCRVGPRNPFGLYVNSFIIYLFFLMKIVSLKEIWREKCTEKKELGLTKEIIWKVFFLVYVFRRQVSSVH